MEQTLLNICVKATYIGVGKECNAVGDNAKPSGYQHLLMAQDKGLEKLS